MRIEFSEIVSNSFLRNDALFHGSELKVCAHGHTFSVEFMLRVRSGWLQATPRKAKAPAELSSIFSSFKNPFAGPFTFGSNGPNASGEVQKPIGSNGRNAILCCCLFRKRVADLHDYKATKSSCNEGLDLSKNKTVDNYLKKQGSLFIASPAHSEK